MAKPRLAASVAVGIVAFLLYRATLLPGFDFGDTGFFQATVGSATLTPRDGYPLYFAIGNAAVWLSHAEPAHTLNLVSAVEGAAASGMLVLAAAELSGSVLAGVASALLFAVSYTFWSQSIIAEVYALHILFVASTVWLLLRWSHSPTAARLSCFFAAYALGFGNHLSMILLLPAFAVFLLISAPGGWKSMFAPRTVLLATAIAAAGALQYLWNLRGLWQWPNEPPTIAQALQTFWFDVTKSDWRETMVLHVPRVLLTDRLVMYRFDVLQQFGWAVLLAPIGLVRLFVTHWRRAVLMLGLYLSNAAFAFSYNVGDNHVFWLPAHACVALLIAPGIVALGFAPWLARAQRRRRRLRPFLAGGMIVYASTRAYYDFPALDRSVDRRPTAVLARLTDGLDDRRAIFLTELNWQLVNGLAYFGKVVRPNLAYAWLSHVLLYLPTLVRDNVAAGRDVVVSERARTIIATAYGPLLPTAVDSRVDIASLTDTVRGLPAGTRYVLCLLRPGREQTLDYDDVRAAIRLLTASTADLPLDSDYAALAGTAGRKPELAIASSQPFRRAASLDGVSVRIRMESWLEFDTIRRMGFGQVVAARFHTLIVERGISFAAFDADGHPLRTAYRANIFAPERRYLVRLR